MRAIRMSDNFDFIIDDSGRVAMDEDANATANMLKFDFISNKNWKLDNRLGLPWLNAIGTGYLQKTGSYQAMLGGISRKIKSKPGIASVESIEIVQYLNRELGVRVKAKLVNGQTLKLEL